MLVTPEPISEPTQLERVQKLLPRWRQLPIYRSWPATGDFSKLPLITKPDLRQDFPHNFLGPSGDLNALLADGSAELEHTSGSSEERTAVLFGRGWWNSQEDHVLRLNPFVSSVLDAYPQARRATIVPPVCNGLVCFNNWTPRSARTVGSTLFINQARIPFLNTNEELGRMAGEVLDWAPVFLDLDPVHGAWFALYCERNGIKFPSVKFLLCSYEFVSVVHRRILERVFGVPVLNLYGSTETGHLFMENEQGEMKASLENIYCEVIAPDERGIGDLVVTTLTNELMPLVRYRIGDLVQSNEEAQAGQYFVHGRGRDALLRHDGRRVTTLDVDRCFADVTGMAHYQFRQLSSRRCQLQYIPERENSRAENLKQMNSRLEELLQLEEPVTVEAVKMLPPLPSGKFRLTSRVQN
jgi:phenylacetate-CoA ligase